MEIEVKSNSDEAKKEVEKAVEAVLDEWGKHISSEASRELENDPRRIDTGLLANSLTWARSGGRTAITGYRADKPDKQGRMHSGNYSGTMPDDKVKSVYIGTNVEYAIYVHEGTSRMIPNRFLKNAVEENQDQLEKIAHQIMDKL